ncbi:hypothetical protein D3C71_1676960 [compost metagenome]
MDRVDRARYAGQAQFQLQMPFLQHAPVGHLEMAVEQRLGEPLPPWPGQAQCIGMAMIEFVRGQFAVAEHLLLQCSRVEHLQHGGDEGGFEGSQLIQTHAQPGGHRMTAEALDQAGMACIDQRQRITDMQARNRTR